MKIEAKDYAQGGIFQMVPERTDKTPTRVTHTLASGIFYCDNTKYRAHEGDFVPYEDTTREVTARDSTQVATRINSPTCANNITTRTGATVVVPHCGQVAIFDVTSGGRMGIITGEDSVEVAPPPTNRTHKCQAQNRVRGRSTVLGAPLPVPVVSRFKPIAP
jgi:hypothetical protein